MKTWGSSTILGIKFCALGAAFLFLVMGPTVVVPFAHIDQYRFFLEDGHKTEEYKRDPYTDREHGFLRVIGRPIAARLEYQIYKRTFEIEDLNAARAVT